METMNVINMLARWGHVLFGITWIGMLYYFNFVQGGYFKSASPEALKDAKAKLAPEALWWFRWGAMFTFLTGLVLLVGVMKMNQMNPYILMGALMGTLMFLNVWLVIWPNQKIALGMVEGDAAAAGAKALLASRTNVLFSAPMLAGMLAGPHSMGMLKGYGSVNLTTGFWIVVAIIALLEANALFGKQGPMTTVKGVITSSLVLTAVCVGVLQAL
ncbi:urate hydroxylase PuuD [Biformimicrobium ophioploci]|uniref:Urate hydroxylase PuuD n=1 Tax=Biformimicrobium ophioploci TaxID=3036711 RepID=A0ABQ6LUJ8_9GAMM|nr:urate hydroxylase PuuD [Microbulbifer sp. NKW57]GMG85753.1 urate hydroxylase PuuD [Microbulbifer sp. NKW57]